MKVGITGINGFLGSALAERFGKIAEVYPYPRPDLDYLFLFGSPSSNIVFDQNIDYCFEETINSFLNAIQFCRDHGIKLIYPSSATVYNKNTTYARCKAALEEIHLAYGGDVLGLRIFAGYGPGEGHKGEYASIVYQFCRQMKHNKRPVIFGNGKQTRDFVYIDDIAYNILLAVSEKKTGIIDIGTGINTSFNLVVKTINKVLNATKVAKEMIEPVYVNKPKHYISETPCQNPSKCYVSLEQGIKKILKTV